MNYRKTSFELLRIIIICVILMCHLFIYNGVYYVEYTNNALYALLLTASTAVPSDYIFISISSYYLIIKNKKWTPYKFLNTLALTITLYILKIIILRSLFGFNNTKYFVDLFLINGAWWYILQYLFLTLYYPLLNRLIHSEKRGRLYLLTIITGIIFLINGVTNIMNIFNDFIAFIFTCLLIGCIYVHPIKCSFFDKHKKKILIILCCLLSVGMIAACIYVKHPNNGFTLTYGNQFIQRIIGRYCFPALIVGLSIFELFRNIEIPYSKTIHFLAQNVIYVFLLHETMLGIFWKFEKCWNTLIDIPTHEFFIWIFIYILACFIFAIFVHHIYTKFIKALWDKLIEKIITQYTERINHDRKQ